MCLVRGWCAYVGGWGAQDGDGVVNKADWMWGLKEYNFPLSKDEANLLFSAIDEDGNGVLTYKEMVGVCSGCIPMCALAHLIACARRRPDVLVGVARARDA